MKMIDWHKKATVSVQRKLHLSDYALLWLSFAKGLIFGLLIYHFFLRWFMDIGHMQSTSFCIYSGTPSIERLITYSYGLHLEELSIKRLNPYSVSIWLPNASNNLECPKSKSRRGGLKIVIGYGARHCLASRSIHISTHHHFKFWCQVWISTWGDW